MEKMQTDNNLFDLLYKMYYQFNNDITVLELCEFLNHYPFIFHQIGIRDKINLKLFLIQIFVIEKQDLWNAYTKLSKMRSCIFQINESEKKKYQVFYIYLSNMVQELQQFIFYNGYQKTREAIEFGLQKDTNLQHAFFLDTTHLPFDKLCGFDTYFNPILSLVFAQDENQKDFLLYDAMCKEISDTKDIIIKKCRQICSIESDVILKQMKRIIWNILEQDYPFANIYYESYYIIISKMLQNIKKMKETGKKRNRTISSCDYDYYSTLLD